MFVIATVAGFLAFSYVLFLVVVGGALFAMTRGDAMPKVLAFLFLFPLLPSLDYSLEVSGFSIIYMRWPRLLAIVLLLPLFIGSLRSKSVVQYPTDKYVLAFFLLNVALTLRDESITGGLRNAFNLILDFLAPYYVISRHINSPADLRRALFALLAAAVMVGLINAFETIRGWHVYELVSRNLTGYQQFSYSRAGMSRAFGPLDRPSASAFMLVAGLGLVWCLSPYPDRKRNAAVAVGILAVGLLATFSRGGWFAAAIIGAAFTFTTSVKYFMRVSAILAIMAFALSFTEVGQRIISVLPFTGNQTEESARTVDYRQELFVASMRVIHESPWFGSTSFQRHPEMEAIRQSSGLLDIVNHYILLLLTSGYVGLVLFVCIFLSAIAMIIRTYRQQPDSGPAPHRYICRGLGFTLCALLAYISATSALGRVGLILWCLVAIAAATSGLYSSPRERRR